MRALVLSLALAACGGSSPATDMAVGADLSTAVLAGDLGTGASCTYNRECVAEARCACDEQTGCFCELGPRGTGKVGVDTCTSGDHCSSSLCVEGPGGVSYCSDECTTVAQCGGVLPRCIEVTFLGRICARNP